MRFSVEQRIGAEPDRVVAALVDPAYLASVGATTKLGAPELLEQRTEGTTTSQDVRYRFIAPLAAAVRAVVDPAQLTWVERSTHDRAAGTSRFELLPDHYPDRLRARGTVTIEPDGAGGTIRRIEGELSVRAPLVARTVERAIVSGLEEHLVEEAELLSAHLAGS